MGRQVFVLPLLTLLIGSSVHCGEAQVSATGADHITATDDDRPVKDQVRYLIGHWPRDFEIAVVKAVGTPTCNRPTEGDCWLRVKPVEVILGHQHERTYVVTYRRFHADARFDMKRGDRIVAMLTPVIRAPKTPMAYIATWLAPAKEPLVDSVRNAVADDLMAGSRCQPNP